MYAVVQSGGKQYRVAVGDKLKVEKLDVDSGDTMQFDRVLMVADGEDVEVGSPTVATPVFARVLGHGRGDKILVFKMKRRKDYRRVQGHRQYYTELQVIGIGEQALEAGPAADAPASVEPAPAAPNLVEGDTPGTENTSE
jgi:large subunit ribosomal protein L21